MLQFACMNDVAAKITAMEHEMKQLRDMMTKVLTAVEDNKRVVAQVANIVLPSDQLREEELFQEAYQLFGITASPDPDDNLIAAPEDRTPIDWSDYAQNRTG